MFNRKRNLRRKFFINWRYQGKFMAAFVGVVHLGIAASTFVMLYVTRQALEQSLYHSHIKASSTLDIILPLAEKVNIVFFLLCLAVVAMLTWWYSRKLDRLESGLVSSVQKFREGRLGTTTSIGFEDEFPDLDHLYNDMSSANRERFDMIARTAREIEDSLAAGVTGPGLKDKIARLSEALSEFKSEKPAWMR